MAPRLPGRTGEGAEPCVCILRSSGTRSLSSGPGAVGPSNAHARITSRQATGGGGGEGSKSFREPTFHGLCVGTKPARYFLRRHASCRQLPCFLALLPVRTRLARWGTKLLVTAGTA